MDAVDSIVQALGNPATRGEALSFLAGNDPVTKGQIESVLKLGQTFALSDLGNAKRLVDRHGADLRFCHNSGKWFVWTGKHWRADDTGEVFRRAKMTVATIYGEASSFDDEDRRKVFAKFAVSSESFTRLRAMVELAKSEETIPVTPGQFDTNPWLLNCLNGTLNLKTGKLQKHSRGDLITKMVPVEYDAHTTCPTWEAFLSRIMQGNGNLISFLKRAVGYFLTGDTSEQAVFFLYGEGANGKSTFIDAISTLLADYSKQTPTETLLVKTSGSGISNDLARLKGARFVSAVESEQGKRLAEALVKQLSGNDRITARFLHSEFFEFKPQFKLCVATNHKPTIQGTDYAIWRRIKLVPFSVTIPEAERDNSLPDKLKSEMAGVLRWAVEGCLEWQRDGLGVPQEVMRATTDYRNEMDVVGSFVDECCITEASAKVRAFDLRVGATDLFKAYQGWCQENGEVAMTQRSFGRELTRRGFQRERGVGGTYYYLGIGLPSEREQLRRAHK